MGVIYAGMMTYTGWGALRRAGGARRVGRDVMGCPESRQRAGEGQPPAGASLAGQWR